MATTAASTQTAIILVTDLVGSTEQRARLGEEAAEERRRVHDQLLVDTVARNGGEVVKGLGDGVLARFAGASDAVAAAVEIQQGTTDAGFDVRVGVSAGDITIEDDDVFGTPVIEASRLCARAEGGQILVAQLVQLLARGRGGHTFTLVGELELKGLPDPVTAAEVGWERLASDGDAGVPLPAALTGTERFPYAGRAAEREAMQEAWKRAVQGERQVVLLSGEPGMGKTRLAMELGRAVHGDGAIVLFGRADEELDAAYRPVGEALGHLVENAPSAMLDAHVAAHGDRLTRLVPELLRRTPDAPVAAPAEEERAALFDAAVDLLGRASAVAPVLLVLDDLHWADHATLLLLRHLARSPAAMALMIVGTYRDTDLKRSHPLAGILADLRRERGVERIDLPGLDHAEIVELMTAAAGHDLNDRVSSLAHAIDRETGGNPFFISEVLRHLAESGVIYLHEGRWTTDLSDADALAVPQGVREVIGRRLSVLGDDAERALRTAAVIGAEFDVELLSALLDQDLDAVIDVLEEPVARHLIVEAPEALGRFRFAHALVRQALAEELSAIKRARLHQRILAALEGAGRSSAAELAHHACEAAAIVGAGRAIELSLAAAQEASAGLAWEQAVTWCRRAVDVEETIEPPDAQRRAKLLAALGKSLNESAQFEAACRELGEAATLARTDGDTELLAEIAILYGGGVGSWVNKRDTLGPQLVDEALAGLDEGDSTTRVELLLRRASWLILTEPDRVKDLTAEALAMARRVGDRALMLEALISRIDAIRGTPDLDAFAALAVEAAALCGPQDRPLVHRAAVAANAWAAWRRGDLAGVAEVTRQLVEIAPRGTALLQARTRVLVATLDLHAGRVERARREAVAVEEMAGAFAGAETLVRGAAITFALLAEPPATFDRLVGEAHEALPDVFAMVVNDAAAAALNGRTQEGVDRLHQWERDVLPMLPDVFVLTGLALASEVRDAVPADMAARFYDRLLPYAGQWLGAGTEIMLGPAHTHLGRFARAAGRLDDAIEHLETAIVDLTRSGEVPYRAHTMVDLADALLTRGAPGDLERARALATEALEVARSVGLLGLVGRAEAQL